MDVYFKYKFFINFVIPAVLVLVFFIGLALFLLNDHFKSRLMKKLGYVYENGLGSNAAREFQSHWVKGNISINCSDVSNTAYRKIRKLVERKENIKSK